MRIACGAHAQYSTGTQVSVGIQSENGVREQNVVVFHSLFLFLFSALESVMELYGQVCMHNQALNLLHFVLVVSVNRYIYIMVAFAVAQRLALQSIALIWDLRHHTS